MRRLGIWAVGVFLIGCSDGGGVRHLPDAPPVIDAAIDAPPPLPLPNREITGGAKHVRGARFAQEPERPRQMG